MFIGHYGIGFAGKKADGRPSLGTLFLAASFLDILWPVFILLGWETVRINPAGKEFMTLQFTSYPYSHSLLAALIWALIFFLVFSYVMSLIGAPPSSTTTVGIVGLSQLVIVAWAYWIDRNRTVSAPVPAAD